MIPRNELRRFEWKVPLRMPKDISEEIRMRQRRMQSFSKQLGQLGDPVESSLLSQECLSCVTSLKLLAISCPEGQTEACRTIRACQSLKKLSISKHGNYPDICVWEALLGGSRPPLLRLEHLIMSNLPLQGIQDEVNLGTLTALALHRCGGLSAFLDDWRTRTGTPINLHTFHITLGSQSAPEFRDIPKSVYNFMGSFSGLVEFALIIRRKDREGIYKVHVWPSEPVMNELLANHFETLKTIVLDCVPILSGGLTDSLLYTMYKRCPKLTGLGQQLNLSRTARLPCSAHGFLDVLSSVSHFRVCNRVYSYCRLEQATKLATLSIEHCMRQQPSRESNLRLVVFDAEAGSGEAWYYTVETVEDTSGATVPVVARISEERARELYGRIGVLNYRQEFAYNDF
ncbi:hypothetical protein FN846DRAFT_923655 [Sphaerosporella brunnea]|uniref:Uncharacterized protein n=1 Tax=Sphaerosporella brunnea TaxID=1250544 RepID=A0A5J5ECZ3_9PEZI|nr:hypothetical protein FN846DRAFT_923655 [Sphaerosporella brunnea]